MGKSYSNNRQELDLNLSFVFASASILTILIYAGLFPFKNSYVGVLLYERGFTQYLVIFLTSFVIATTINKLIKVKLEFNCLNKNWLPKNITFDDPRSPKLLQLWRELSQETCIIASRCSRIISAYINSGNKNACSDLAIDDSSFYLTASESSYALPRILVWAIPLLGFIGTVLGISSAVNGFSIFLEKSEELDQIKEGIGTVTSGLAVAFDTTLLALFLSVLVMIPLVLVEKLESRLLLQIDVYINDRLLPRLKEKKNGLSLDTETLKNTINEAIKINLPSKIDLIKPAEDYVEKASKTIAESIIAQFSNIQSREKELVETVQKINQITLEDRQEFLNSLSQQQSANHSIILEIQYIISEIKRNSEDFSSGFKEQASVIRQELNQAANSLENQVIALEQVTQKIVDLNQMLSSWERITNSLEKTEQLESTLSQIKDNIALLHPVLQDLLKPRFIKLVEEIAPND
jgi:hypothetical protein